MTTVVPNAGDPGLRPFNKGAYGCVYTPPLPCAKSKRDTKKRAVGKITRKTDGRFELRMAELIKAIPGWENYYIVQERDQCAAANFARLRTVAEKQCTVYKRHSDDNLIQLLSRYGGATLTTVQFEADFPYLEKLEYVLEGVAKLNRQGICHYDLNDKNVLIDLEGNFRIIDFGQAFQGDLLTGQDIGRFIYEFSPGYRAQPPEVSVMSGLYEGLTLQFCVNQTMEHKQEFEWMQNYLGLTKAEQMRSLFQFWHDDRTKYDKSWVTFFHAYWRTWDAWAIGVMFLKILKTLYNSPVFQKTTWGPHSETIQLVLQGCCASNPLKRYTAEEALMVLKASRAKEKKA